MLEIRQVTQFKRDAKLARKQGRDLTKLQAIIDLLVAQIPLPEKNRDHALGHNWRGHRECHIEPDWLLIYRITDNELVLTRTGSHSLLFGS